MTLTNLNVHTNPWFPDPAHTTSPPQDSPDGTTRVHFRVPPLREMMLRYLLTPLENQQRPLALTTTTATTKVLRSRRGAHTRRRGTPCAPSTRRRIRATTTRIFARHDVGPRRRPLHLPLHFAQVGTRALDSSRRRGRRKCSAHDVVAGTAATRAEEFRSLSIPAALRCRAGSAAVGVGVGTARPAVRPACRGAVYVGERARGRPRWGDDGWGAALVAWVRAGVSGLFE